MASTSTRSSRAQRPPPATPPPGRTTARCRARVSARPRAPAGLDPVGTGLSRSTSKSKELGDARVYHNDDACPVGQQIHAVRWEEGKGKDLKQCPTCGQHDR